METDKFNLSLIIIGNQSVGKTAILRRKKDETFINNNKSTIGIDCIKF
jgi:GTPase SAR1 family protein